jgi:Cu2+-exporting ATPase
MTIQSCYHCGLEVPPDNDFALVIDGVRRAMCCPGCAAVASTIMQNGLQRFYQFRSAPSGKIYPDSIENSSDNPFADWDLDEIQQSYVSETNQGIKTLRLAIDNISCAACTWLIEKHLGKLPGVVRVAINGTTHRGELSWQPQSIHLSQILMALRQIGYDPRPINSSSDLSPSVNERRDLLLRLGVAGLAMMQTGMVAIALYAGSFQGMAPEWQTVLRLVSALFVTPVVLYSAQPFFRGAWRSIKTGHMVMDLPVALAVGLAYCASIWATFADVFSDSILLAGGGEVYFDSIAMLIFFLLLGRFAEQSIREKNLRLLDRGTLLPPVALQVFPGQSPAVADKRVPIATLAVDDFIRVDAGRVIPCDGIIEQGRSQISEAVLSGESRPVDKQTGDSVYAGTVNGANPLLIKVTAVGEATSLSAILQLAERAAAEKPPWAMLADRLAAMFVAALLVIAALVASYWWLHEPARMLWVTLSVLVVTCPCALSLATPTALTVATTLLRRQGFLIHRGHVLEALPAINRVIFDKTGTLTEGDLKLSAIQRSEAADQRSGEISNQRLIGWAAALEQGSEHAIARAFQQQLPRGFILPAVEQQTFVTGCGVSAVIDKQQFFLGNLAWVCEQAAIPRHFVCSGVRAQQHKHCIEVALACTGLIKKDPRDEQQETGEARKSWLALFYFADQLRPSALEAVEQLRQRGLKVSLLSGDRSPTAADIVAPLELRDCQFGLLPQQKLDVVRHLQTTKNNMPGEKILMVGDGINDVPVLQGADISVAMGRASDLSRIHADATLLGTDLTMLPRAIEIAAKTRRVIEQNIGWAIGYNLVALPLAAAGYVAPWAAAIGMSASSLLVLLNALRLSRQDSGDAQPLIERPYEAHYEQPVMKSSL